MAMGLSFNTVILIVMLLAMVLAAMGTVLLRSLLMSAVSLALTSVFLAAVLFLAGMQIAAVMELLVCTGLVTAIFASAIALLQPDQELGDKDPGDKGGSAEGGVAGSKQPVAKPGIQLFGVPADIARAETRSGDASPDSQRGRLAQALGLLGVMMLLTAAVIFLVPGLDIDILGSSAGSAGSAGTQSVLWEERASDIVGLTLLILGGVLGVAAMLRQREEK